MSMRNSRAVALLLIALCLPCAGCFVECEEITLGRGQSPDGVYGARAFAIDCGAVGDFNVTITLTRNYPVGFSSRRHVLSAMGRFTASFDWPDSRSLRVTVTCAAPGFCTDDEKAKLRGQVASSDPVWRGLRVEYSVE